MRSSTKRNSKVRIKDLPLSLRPREKLLALGATNLSDAELLAILLGTGKRGQNVVVLSEVLLRRHPLRELGKATIKDFASIGGIGNTKATRIAAALELGERVFSPATFTKVIIRSTEDALAQLREVALKRQEYLIVFYLNARYELLRKEVVGIGSLNNLRITPKEIFSPALQTPCAFLIVAHNHPSGDPTPSDDDIQFTTRIHDAGEVMGIPLLDHLIVGKSGYFSFRDNKKG
jgi:DNA repair protein RadC